MCCREFCESDDEEYEEFSSDRYNENAGDETGEAVMDGKGGVAEREGDGEGEEGNDEGVEVTAGRARDRSGRRWYVSGSVSPVCNR